MRFNQESDSRATRIRSYAPGELKINDGTFTQPTIVSSDGVAAGPAVRSAEQITAEHAGALLAHEPELVLLGTGTRQVFPDAAFGAAFLQTGIGFEVMDTAAACRTFNVLVAERRRVVALLLP